MFSKQPPKISGVLNNCALHVIVPELLMAIEYFASIEEANGKTEESEEKIEAFRAQYEKLKIIFAQFYNMNTRALTWKKWQDLLTTSVKNNTTAVQFIMGPVLREFMSVNMNKTDCVAIQNNGRYSTLDAETVAEYVCKPLGISLISYSKTSRTDRLYQVIDENEVDKPAYHIEIYNENNGKFQHWERKPYEDVPELVNDAWNLAVDCESVQVAFEVITSSKEIESTLLGLDILKVAVNSYFTQLDENKVEVELPKIKLPEQELILSVEQTELIETTTNPVVKEMVKELLVKSNQGFFNVPENKKIIATVDGLNKAEAMDKEIDEDFAKRLQEAEIRFAKKR